MNIRHGRGRSIVPIIGAALAVLAMSGFAAGSASAATQYWYTCVSGFPKGAYEDSSCTKASETGTYSWRRIPGSTPVAFSMKNTTNFTFTLSYYGAPFEVVCTSLVSEGGSLENSAAGILSLSKINLSNCKVPIAKGKCNVTVVGKPLSGEATEFEAKPAVRFGAPETTVFAITFTPVVGQKCVYSENFYEGKFELKGSFTGIVNSSNSTLEFTEASSAMSWIGAFQAKLAGTSKLELGTGETWKVGP